MIDEKLDIVILAAGKGTRMGIKTPKALVMLAGKPMINYLLASVKEISSRPPILVVSPDNLSLMKKSLKEFDCRFVVQDEQLGTGHAVRVLFDKNVDLAENTLILYSDHPLISSQTIKKLVNKHISSNSSFSMLVASVPNFNGIYHGFYHDGRVIRGKTGKVVKIVELSDATEKIMKVKEINPAIFIFKTSWLKKYVYQIKINEIKKEYYLTQLIEIAQRTGTDILPVEGDIDECFGVNTLEQLATVEKIIKKKH